MPIIRPNVSASERLIYCRDGISIADEVRKSAQELRLANLFNFFLVIHKQALVERTPQMFSPDRAGNPIRLKEVSVKFAMSVAVDFEP